MEFSQEIVKKYNKQCLHYDLVANGCYEKRRNIGYPTGLEYLPYIIAALISFDMKQYMGKSGTVMYDTNLDGFANRLWRSINAVAREIESFEGKRIIDININESTKSIAKIYNELSRTENLHNSKKSFHVGATKIMHFIHPELFPIVDSNAARMFRSEFGIEYQNTTQPGYSDERYIQSLNAIKNSILKFGVVDFMNLEKGTPLTRIFDKLAFIQGSGN